MSGFARVSFSFLLVLISFSILQSPSVSAEPPKGQKLSSKTSEPSEQTHKYLKAIRTIWTQAQKDHKSPGGKFPSCHFRTPEGIAWDNDRTQHAIDTPLPERYQHWKYLSEVRAGDQVLGTLYMTFFRDDVDRKKIPARLEKRIFEKNKKTTFYVDNTKKHPEWTWVTEDSSKEDEKLYAFEHSILGEPYLCEVMVVFNCPRCARTDEFEKLLLEIKDSISLRKGD